MSDLSALAEDMAKRDVRHIFGIPGSGSSLTLLDELEKREVLFHLTHFEGTAALMAGAVGRLSGRAGVALSIKGPGLANMVPGLAACSLEALPVVSISEAYLPGTPPSKAHKRINHEGLISAVSKGRRFLAKKGPRFPDLAHWAESEVPGPVHLDISESGIEVEESIPVPRKDRAQEAFPKDKLSELISLAERPVLIAGTLALRKNLSMQLNQLAVPVFSVAAAKGVIDETLPQSAGVYTGVGMELTPEFSILPEADLVIGIGLRHNEMLGVKPFPCRAINLDPLGEELCSGFEFDHVFEGSQKEMEVVFAALAGKEWGLGYLETCLVKMRERLFSGQFMPAHAFQIMEQHFQHGARLVLDTGNFCTIGEHIWRVPEPRWYLSSGQGRYMGVGLPMALGAAVYDTSIPTVACLGDGGIGMFIADIKLAVKYQLPLLIVLMSDSHLGSIRMRSIRDGLTEKPTLIHQPSWMKAVEGLGVYAAQATNETEIEKILQSWNYSEGPLFMEIAFDPEGYQHMTRDIR